MEEIWVDIPGYEGKYKISNFGNIYSQKIKRLSKLQDKKGYKYIQLGRGDNHQVHRLVMLSFVGPSSLIVDHINSDPSDNRLSNLQYVSHSENNRLTKSRGRAALGEKKNQSKLSDKDALHIRDESNKGVPIKKIADGYGISVAAISMIKNKRTWKHV